MLLCLLISSAITIDECAVGEADLTSIDMHDVTVSNNKIVRERRSHEGFSVSITHGTKIAPMICRCVRILISG